MITLSASLTLSTGFTASPTVALGISSDIFAAVGLILLENALKASGDDDVFNKPPSIAASGNSLHMGPSDGPMKKQQLFVLRDVAVVVTVVSGLAAYLMEPRLSSSTISWEPIYRFGGDSVKTVRHYKTVQLVLIFILVNTAVNMLTYLIVSNTPVKLAYRVALWFSAHLRDKKQSSQGSFPNAS